VFIEIFWVHQEVRAKRTIRIAETNGKDFQTMGVAITDPAELILADAADLIETRGWDRLANSCATGALSVRGALETATNARDWEPYGHTDAGTEIGVTADHGERTLAAYVIDTVFVPVHALWVNACPACVQCREHADRPLTLIRNQNCPNGCALCDDHDHLTDPHGPDLQTEDVIDVWEGYMQHRRDVISVLRAAASRAAL
jgi:hypothetical protein